MFGPDVFLILLLLFFCLCFDVFFDGGGGGGVQLYQAVQCLNSTLGNDSEAERF